jgi:hypothetical protein
MTMMSRRAALLGMAAFAMPRIAPAEAEQAGRMAPVAVMQNWYRLVLKLVRHTPTYSPPVASRAFAYLGVAAYEAAASGSKTHQSVAGQLNGLRPVPKRMAGQAYDDAVILHAALAFAVRNFFSNTGPTGQRVLGKFETKLGGEVSAGLSPDMVERSGRLGRAIAEHIIAWSQDDGGVTIENMGFPLQYDLTKGKARWIPTSLIAQQQKPLLPNWGRNRTFAMPDGAACPLPPPPEYSEEKDSEFYTQALEVYDVTRQLSDEQRAIARFWSDDPMLSPTPPGHWLAIALDLLQHGDAGLEQGADILMRVGVTAADAFIACWNSKFQFDLLRPVTYIRRVIDPKWEPLLITPPFPEYPSGHSTQSSAVAEVLSAQLGEAIAFDDLTHQRDGLPPRSYASFRAAAVEAGISRLYGGIHFRAAIERGLEQGRCVGAYANALRTKV